MNTKLHLMTRGQGERLNVLGELVTILATGVETGGSYSLLETETAPQGGAPMHYHTKEDEAFFVLEGEYELVMPDRTVKLTAGSFAFVPRGTVATYRNAGTTWGRMLVLCTPGGHEEFMRAIGQPLRDGERPAPGGPPTPEQAGFLISTAAKFGVTVLPPNG